MDTKSLANRKVWVSHPTKNNPDAIRKIGRIHSFVFHPSKPQLVGFLVKRPDIALMFRRKELFVAFNGFDLFDDVILRDDPKSLGRGATKALGINLDQCTIWVGLPVICVDGTSLGLVENVVFDDKTGRVQSVVVSGGATANALLGRREIPGEMVKGFRRGMGAKLVVGDGAYAESDDDEAGGDTDANMLGAIMVDNEAAAIEAVGGVAEKAGETTAVAADKAKKTYKKVVRKVKPVADEAAEKAGNLAKTADEAAQKGAYITGRQIGRTKGMFSNFKKEFDRGMQGEDKES